MSQHLDLATDRIQYIKSGYRFRFDDSEARVRRLRDEFKVLKEQLDAKSTAKTNDAAASEPEPAQPAPAPHQLPPGFEGLEGIVKAVATIEVRID